MPNDSIPYDTALINVFHPTNARSCIVATTHALVLSQVVLSLVLPIPMVALVRFTARRDVMGEFANTRLTNGLAITATGFVCLLNGILLLAIAGLAIPFAGG